MNPIKWPSDCPCGEEYINKQARKILDEMDEKMGEIAPDMVEHSAGIFGLEKLLEHVGAHAVGKWFPLLDVAAIAYEFHLINKYHQEAQNKLDKLFAPCKESGIITHPTW
jgi:hypothetical protein